jgi:hypothetical protein
MDEKCFLTACRVAHQSKRLAFSFSLRIDANRRIECPTGVRQCEEAASREDAWASSRCMAPCRSNRQALTADTWLGCLPSQRTKLSATATAAAARRGSRFRILQRV